MRAHPSLIRLNQSECRFVLAVLELDALRAPKEDDVGVVGIDDVLDLEAEVFGFGNVIRGGLDAEAEVVEARTLDVAPGPRTSSIAVRPATSRSRTQSAT